MKREPKKPKPAPVAISEQPESITVWVKGWGHVFSSDGKEYLGPVA